MVSAGTSVAIPTTLAGEPATRACGGTGFSTSDPEAIRAPSPMVMFPRIVQCAPRSTPRPICERRGERRWRDVLIGEEIVE